MRKLLLFALMISCARVITAQQDPPLENVKIPISPTAASFMDYSQFPSPGATGKLPIGIPLLSLDEGSLGMDISLNYQSADGVKVTDISGVVGLGWSLSIGGAITRNVNGVPDEKDIGYLNTGNQIDNFSGTDTQMASYLDAVVNGSQDTQPDVFNFYYPGGGGSFVYTTDGEIITLPYQDVLITGSIDTGFELTTNNGVTYYYTIIEKTTKLATTCGWSSTIGAYNEFNSAWFLDRIEGPNCELINYTYDSSAYNYEWTPNEQHDGATITRQSCQSNVNSNNKYVTNISSTKYDVEFIYSTTNRNDLPGAPRLDEIKMKSKSGAIIKWYKFNYSETQSAAGSGYFGTYYTLQGSAHSYRLFLDNIRLYTSDGTDSELYRGMEYNTTLLPSRVSTGVDIWGYYNGKNTNNSYVNETKMLVKQPASVADDIIRMYGTADRMVDTTGTYTQAGILTKLTYPTGGYTSYEYEPNTFNDLSKNFSVKKKYIYKNYVCGGQDCEERTDVFSVFFDGPSSVSGSFEINKTQEVSFDAFVEGSPTCTSHEITITGNGENILINGGPNDVVNEFTRTLNPGTYQVTVSACNTEAGSSLKPAELKVSHVYLLGNTNTSVVTGGLRIKKVSNCNNGSDCLVQSFGYEDGSTSFGELLYNPNMIHYEVVHDCGFDPNMPESVNRSLDWATVFSYLGCNTSSEDSYFIQHVKAFSNAQLNSWGQSHINYAKITVEQEDGLGASNGKRVLSFTSLSDYQQMAFEFELEPTFNRLFFKTTDTYPTLSSYLALKDLSFTERSYITYDPYFFQGAQLPYFFWLIGKPKLTEVFDASNNLLTSTETTYDVRFGGTKDFKSNNSSGVVNTARGMNVINHSGLVDNGLPLGYYIIRYDIPSVWMEAKQVDNYAYDGGGTLHTQSLYEYDTTHFLLKKSSQFDSKGVEIETLYTYPFDYTSSASAAIADMKTNHRNASPISTTVLRDGKATSSSVMKYALAGSDVVLDESVVLVTENPISGFSQSTDAQGYITSVVPAYTYDQSLKITDYVRCDIPTRVLKSDGITEVYLWDDTETLVIARATNAAIDQVSFNSFDQTPSTPWSFSGSPVNGGYTGSKGLDVNATSNALAAGDYIVSFWAKGASGQIKAGASNWVNTTNDWKHYQLEINHTSGGIAIQVQGGVTYDEVMIYPKSSVMSGYTYDDTYRVVGESSGTSAKHYQYDGYGRLKAIKDLDGNVVQALDYNFRN